MGVDEQTSHQGRGHHDHEKPVETASRTEAQSTPESAARAVTVVSVVANLLRGALMGLAELVPGVSGGTVALIVGVYERLVDSANHLVTAIKRVVLGPDRASWWSEVRRAEWG